MEHGVSYGIGRMVLWALLQREIYKSDLIARLSQKSTHTCVTNLESTEAMSGVFYCITFKSWKIPWKQRKPKNKLPIQLNYWWKSIFGLGGPQGLKWMVASINCANLNFFKYAVDWKISQIPIIAGFPLWKNRLISLFWCSRGILVVSYATWLGLVLIWPPNHI